MTNTDKIAALEKVAITLEERINNVRHSVERMESSASESSKLLSELDKRLTGIERDVRRSEKDIETIGARRWQIAAVLISVVFGSVGTLIVKMLIDRNK